LEGISSRFVNVKYEWQQKLEVVVFHKLLVRGAVPLRPVHFDKAVGRSGLVRRKSFFWVQVDAEIPCVVEDDRLKEIHNLLQQIKLWHLMRAHLNDGRSWARYLFSKVVKERLPFGSPTNVKAFLSMPGQSRNKFVKELKGGSGILAKLEQVGHCLFLIIYFNPGLCCLVVVVTHSIGTNTHISFIVSHFVIFFSTSSVGGFPAQHDVELSFKGVGVTGRKFATLVPSALGGELRV
jgi:hypothetical protein